MRSLIWRGGTDSPTAVGGMISKISAARLATRSGAGVFITSGSRKNALLDWFDPDKPEITGTLFLPFGTEIDSHKRWLAFFESPAGVVHVDAGACDALKNKGSSLLAIGVTHTEKIFHRKDVVDVCDPNGKIFARGVTQFSSEQLEQIKGLDSKQIQKLYPVNTRFEVLHRDALVIL